MRKHYNSLPDLIYKCCHVFLSFCEFKVSFQCILLILHLRAITDAHCGILESHGTLQSL